MVSLPVTIPGSGAARSTLCALLLCCLTALFVPAAGSAAVFEVDTIGDGPDVDPGAPCETALGTCSLRAAIEVANGTPGIPDEIHFKSNPFDGQLDDTIGISPLTPLPAIVDSVVIDGDANGAADGQCTTEAGIEGPCVGLDAPAGLAVESDGVAIEGLAITGAQVGIQVLEESQSFAARGDWIGIDLEGEKNSGDTGILLDRGADLARIGGPAARERNVIAGHDEVGLDVLGASNATVLGNYFGVGIDGVTVVPNQLDIEITDSTAAPAFPAIGNEVGATVSDTAVESAPCDGGCNVIANAAFAGMELEGNAFDEEAPPTGPTEIHGNFIGLAADGSEAVGQGTGISIAEAGEVTIGGESEGDANFFAGGVNSVLSAAAPDLTIEANAVGFDSLKTGPVTPPAGFAFAITSEGLDASQAARIAGNVVSLGPDTEVGVSHEGDGATIVDNAISGGDYGILAVDTAAQGNRIVGNTIGGAAEAGIELANGNNEVLGNEVIDAGGPGIRVATVAVTAVEVDGNLIGGDAPGTENTISGSGGPAIEIETPEASQNEIGRNRGEGNAGPFIDLVPELPGENGPNGGIEPPAFEQAGPSTASGTALPGARVRVFRKASAEPGELGSFLGEAIADAGGEWDVAFPSRLPGGTIVAATQTNTLGGTSELGTATLPPDPPAECPDALPAAICVKPPPPPPPPDAEAPRARIGKGPKARSTSTTAKFQFSSNEPGSTFQCRLDKGRFRSCRSPRTYRNLKAGKHVFRLRAIDLAGNVGPVAKRKFTVLP